jgi:hypothetical protein
MPANLKLNNKESVLLKAGENDLLRKTFFLTHKCTNKLESSIFDIVKWSSLQIIYRKISRSFREKRSKLDKNLF